MSWKVIHHILAATLFFSCLCLISFRVSAATLTLPQSKEAPSLVLSLVIDEVENLAGMKLTLLYPQKYLVFKEAIKTPEFVSFMHVINDKIPGKLIIVMASAKGVSGKDLKLFDFAFSLVPGAKPASVSIEPTGCQLMSDSLKDMVCNTSISTVSIGGSNEGSIGQ
jgi:hypothetical protein